MAREKLDLEKRRQALREKQASESAAARAATAAAKEEGKEDLTTDSTDGHGYGAEGEKEEPFRLWTPAELAEYQPMVLEAMRKNPLLRQMLEPDEDPDAPEERAHHEEHQEHGPEPVEGDGGE